MGGDKECVRRGWRDVGVYCKDPGYDVLSSHGDRFSVRGYRERAKRAFGDFYLGQDHADGYDRLAQIANPEIMKITRQQGFDLARQSAMQAIGGQNGLTIKSSTVSQALIADFSRTYYGLPDGVNVVPGGMTYFPWRTPSCPGDFAPLSAHIFYSRPLWIMTQIGRDAGQRLKKAALQFIDEQRRLPAADRAFGIIGRELDTKIPDETELAETIIGHIMGLSPTMEHNFNNVLKRWRSEKRLVELRDKLLTGSPGGDDMQHAENVILPEMNKTIQEEPVPGEVWRTSTKDQTVPGHACPISNGDYVSVNIKEITKRESAMGNHQVDPVFGGIRPGAGQQVHACPGYEMAIGGLLGAFVGLLTKVR